MKTGQCLIVFSAAICAMSIPATVAAQGAVPPPLEQTTADCARPSYASDQLACGDGELRQLDERLAALTRQASQPSSTGMFESDNKWFKRRSRCAFETDHRSCLIDAYTDRITAVEAISKKIGSGKAAACKDRLGTRRVLVRHANNGQFVIRDRNQQLIGVASEKTEGKVWKPALTFTASGRNYIFEREDGRRFSCKLR